MVKEYMTSESISITKGFGILFMVMAHAGCPKVAHDFIYMFHMPLFYIMSGYCFKSKYVDTPLLFIKKRIKNLYLPFVKYCLLFLVFHNVFYYCNIYNGDYGYQGKVSYLYSLSEFGIRALHIITGMYGNEQLLGGYWFIKQLFFGAIIAFFAIKYIKDTRLVLILLLAITLLTKAFPMIRIHYVGIDSLSFFASSFYVMGYIVRQIKFQLHWYYAVAFFVLVTVGSVYIHTSTTCYTQWNALPYFVCAVGGTLMICYVSDIIAQYNGVIKRVMVYIGNHTLAILTWHFLSFKVVSLFIIYFYHLPIERLAEFPVIVEYQGLFWGGSTIVAVSLSLLANKVDVAVSEWMGIKFTSLKGSITKKLG